MELQKSNQADGEDEHEDLMKVLMQKVVSMVTRRMDKEAKYVDQGLDGAEDVLYDDLDEDHPDEDDEDDQDDEIRDNSTLAVAETIERVFASGLARDTDSPWRMLERIEECFSDKAEIAKTAQFLNELRLLDHVHSFDGKARAWIRLALREGLIHRWVVTLSENRDMVAEFYSEDAFLLTKQSTSLLESTLRPLIGIKVPTLLVDDPLLDTSPILQLQRMDSEPPPRRSLGLSSPSTVWKSPDKVMDEWALSVAPVVSGSTLVQLKVSSALQHADANDKKSRKLNRDSVIKCLQKLCESHAEHVHTSATVALAAIAADHDENHPGSSNHQDKLLTEALVIALKRRVTEFSSEESIIQETLYAVMCTARFPLNAQRMTKPELLKSLSLVLDGAFPSETENVAIQILERLISCAVEEETVAMIAKTVGIKTLLNLVMDSSAPEVPVHAMKAFLRFSRTPQLRKMIFDEHALDELMTHLSFAPSKVQAYILDAAANVVLYEPARQALWRRWGVAIILPYYNNEYAPTFLRRSAAKLLSYMGANDVMDPLDWEQKQAKNMEKDLEKILGPAYISPSGFELDDVLERKHSASNMPSNGSATEKGKEKSKGRKGSQSRPSKGRSNSSSSNGTAKDGQGNSKPRRGVRVLVIDGGGTRGLVALEMLRELERLTKQKTPDLFDLICGTSTGGILAFGLGVKRKSLDELDALYRSLSQKVFHSVPLMSTGKVIVTGAKYGAGTFSKILQREVGDDVLIDTSMRPGVKKVFAVSALVSRLPPRPYLFKNYQSDIDRPSRYDSTCTSRLYEGLRATSAAPTYFESFTKDGEVHQDGGLVVNNPAAIAVHEATRIWKDRKIDCLISLGTGWPPAKDVDASGFASVVSTVLWAATDVDRVHEGLEDCMPKGTYFRFHPVHSVFGYGLDETAEAALDEMRQCTIDYIRKEKSEFLKAADALMRGREEEFGCEGRPSLSKAISESRFYRSKSGRLRPVSIDHSFNGSVDDLRNRIFDLAKQSKRGEWDIIYFVRCLRKGFSDAAESLLPSGNLCTESLDSLGLKADQYKDFLRLIGLVAEEHKKKLFSRTRYVTVYVGGTEVAKCKEFAQGLSELLSELPHSGDTWKALPETSKMEHLQQNLDDYSEDNRRRSLTLG